MIYILFNHISNISVTSLIFILNVYTFIDDLHNLLIQYLYHYIYLFEN